MDFLGNILYKYLNNCTWISRKKLNPQNVQTCIFGKHNYCIQSYQIIIQTNTFYRTNIFIFYTIYYVYSIRFKTNVIPGFAFITFILEILQKGFILKYKLHNSWTLNSQSSFHLMHVVFMSLCEINSTSYQTYSIILLKSTKCSCNLPNDKLQGNQWSFKE